MEERPAIWRVVVNILNSSSGQLKRCGPPDWGLGEVLKTAHCKTVSCYEMFKEPRTGNDTVVRQKERKWT